MKKLLLVFLALFAFAAQAQIVPSIPYTLTNGSLADATQVMGNFNTIVTDVNANAATNGANTNITSMTGLTTPLANTYGGTVIYTGGTTGGSANAQTLATVVPSNFALTAGNIVTGTAGFTNTNSTTLSVNGGSAKAVKTQVNNGGVVALTGGEIASGSSYMFYYDGTQFILMNSSLFPLTAFPYIAGDTALVNNTNGFLQPLALALTSNTLLGAAGANIAAIPLASSQVLGVGSTGNMQGLALSSNFGSASNSLTLNLSPLSNILSGDVALNNTANFFDGPVVSQGTVGTWFVSGTITISGGANTANIDAKLWDGTTVCASGNAGTISNVNSSAITMSLSCIVTSPGGNMRISAKDSVRTDNSIKANSSGSAKDSSIFAIRIQ